jgi:hypothetical protein
MQASTLSVRPDSANRPVNTKSSKRRNRAASAIAAHVAYEALEGRQFFSAVAWTGAGDGVNWSDPANWSGNTMPASSDDVTINVAANPNIQISGSRTVHSLNTAESLTVGSGATLTVGATAISSQNVTINGGTISGGTWTFSGGTGISLANANNSITGATINGDLFFNVTSARTRIEGGTTFTTAHLTADSTSIGFAPGSTLSGNVLFEGTGTQNRYIELTGTGTLSLGPTASIKTAPGFAGTANIGGSNWYGGSLTLNNGGLISSEVSAKTVNINGASLTNTGTLRALNGATLSVNPTNWSSSGTISAMDSTLNFNGTWANTGPLSINNSTLNLNGNFTTAGLNLAGFTRSGGTVNLTGTLDNNSATLPLSSTTGSWNLLGGTINGGQITFANGQTLNITSTGGNVLNNVAIAGDLSLATDGAHVALTGSTSFNTAHLIGNGTSVGFGPGYTLNGTVLFEGAGSQSRYVESSGAGTLTIGATGAIKTAAGFAGTANIGGSNWYGGSMTLVNNGLIRSDVSGRTLTITGASFTNNATTEVTGGTLNLNSTNWTNAAAGNINANGATVKFSGAWSNAGTLSLTNSPLTLGGTFSTSSFNFAGFSRSGTGAVDLTGTLNNAGATLTLNSATGAWNLLAGVVNGGTITSLSAQTLVPSASGGTLNNVTVSGDITLDVNNAHLKLAGSTTFDTAHLGANGTSLAFDGGSVLNRPVIFEGTGTLGRYVEISGGNNTLTIDPAGSITSAPGFAGTSNVNTSFWYGTGTLTNNGLIRSDVTGRTLNIGGTSFTNGGTVQITNGTLNLNANNWSNAAAGTINAASSTVNFSGTWSNPGALSVNNTTLKLDGTFSTSSFNFPGFSRTGGIVNLTGTLNNASSTLTLNSATGAWNLLAGTINGGQLNSATAQGLVLTSTGGTLNNVTVTGDISADATNAHAKLAGTTAFNALHLIGDGTGVAFDAGYTLNNPITFEGAGTQGRYVELGATGTLTIGASGSIKTVGGFGGTGNIGGSFWYGGTMTLDVQGTISSEVNGKAINVKPSTSLNISGTTQVLNNGVLNIDLAGPATISATGNATASHFRVNSLTIDGAAAVAPAGNNNGLSVVNSLVFNGSGSIDLNDNDLMLNYTGTSPLAAVQSMINASRNGGSWDGTGAIRSTKAKNANPRNTTLAAIEAADYRGIYGAGSAFDGVTPAASAVLVKYTYYGDADFNGKVNFDDYVRTDNGFNNHSSGWTSGDFDANGQVNFDDYVLIDLAYNTQSGTL